MCTNASDLKYPARLTNKLQFYMCKSNFEMIMQVNAVDKRYLDRNRDEISHILLLLLLKLEITLCARSRIAFHIIGIWL